MFDFSWCSSVPLRILHCISLSFIHVRWPAQLLLSLYLSFTTLTLPKTSCFAECFSLPTCLVSSCDWTELLCYETIWKLLKLGRIPREREGLGRSPKKKRSFLFWTFWCVPGRKTTEVPNRPDSSRWKEPVSLSWTDRSGDLSPSKDRKYQRYYMNPPHSATTSRCNQEAG